MQKCGFDLSIDQRKLESGKRARVIAFLETPAHIVLKKRHTDDEAMMRLRRMRVLRRVAVCHPRAGVDQLPQPVGRARGIAQQTVHAKRRESAHAQRFSVPALSLCGFGVRY
jgi:hypothetical protein